MKHLQTTIFLVPALSSRGSRLSFRMATVHLFIFWGKLFYDPLIFLLWRSSFSFPSGLIICLAFKVLEFLDVWLWFLSHASISRWKLPSRLSYFFKHDIFIATKTVANNKTHLAMLDTGDFQRFVSRLIETAGRLYSLEVFLQHRSLWTLQVRRVGLEWQESIGKMISSTR